MNAMLTGVGFGNGALIGRGVQELRIGGRLTRYASNAYGGLGPLFGSFS